MTRVSPLLQNKLNNTNNTINPNNRHEKIYEDLQKRAHEAKPNEAKAQMVKDGILGNPISATTDTFKDGANFFKAVHTGNLGDNNLGRINDLGLKIGAGIIATYLALHSKTKTESIMRFIGGGTFIAAMSLWPKLFINLPARLIHGFRIDEKYISAQGDKKDFFLDNQFLVWDAYPEEKLRKNAQRAGIDYDSKNGKEKIQRKMQKTALQNRTLWMATAGFATPLLTSMVGNFVEPLVKDAVINHQFQRVKKATEGGIPEHIKGLKAIPQDKKALESLISEYQAKALDDKFFARLADTLVPHDFLGEFKDPDDLKAFKGFAPHELIEKLKLVRQEANLSTFNEQELRNLLKEAKSIALEERKGAFSRAIAGKKEALATLSDAQINKIIESLGGDFSYKKVAAVLRDSKTKIAPEDIEKILAKATDNSKFFEFIRKYNDGPLATLRARARGYIDLVNPILGSKAESVYTDKYIRTTTGNLLKTFGFSYQDLLKLRGANPDDISGMISARIIEQIKDMDENQYREYITKLARQKQFNGLTELTAGLGDIENIKSIAAGLEMEGIDSGILEQLNRAVLGGKDEHKGLLNIIRQFIKTKQFDFESSESKAIICANFERRLLCGDLKDKLSEEDIKIARKMLYDGTISTAKNKGYAANPKDADRVAQLIFDEAKFGTEKSILGRIGETVSNLQAIFVKGGKHLPSEDYLSCGSLSDTIKKCATALGNNKTWMRIFGPMTLALIAVTLLVQPLFGNIKKEFPEEKNGGAK